MEQYVCIGKNGNIKSSNTIGNAVKRICRNAGVPYISPHGLRHLCATILIENGADLEWGCKNVGAQIRSDNDEYLLWSIRGFG